MVRLYNRKMMMMPFEPFDDDTSTWLRVKEKENLLVLTCSMRLLGTFNDDSSRQLYGK